MAKQSSLRMASEPAPKPKRGNTPGAKKNPLQSSVKSGNVPSTGSVQPSLVDHDTYAGAHATYSKFDPATLRAHKEAINDVMDGLTAQTQAQLTARTSKIHSESPFSY